MLLISENDQSLDPFTAFLHATTQRVWCTLICNPSMPSLYKMTRNRTKMWQSPGYQFRSKLELQLTTVTAYYLESNCKITYKYWCSCTALSPTSDGQWLYSCPCTADPAWTCYMHALLHTQLYLYNLLSQYNLCIYLFVTNKFLGYFWTKYHVTLTDYEGSLGKLPGWFSSQKYAIAKKRVSWVSNSSYL